MENLGFGGGQVPTYDQSEPKMAHMPTMAQRLDMAVRQAEDRLKAAQRAKEIFTAHPELEELINILQRGHF